MNALADVETMDFIRKTGAASKLAGSVCTGSLLLGAAGLLKDYEATSHWQTLELLPLCGARPSKKRVVFDRDRVTGAGVTAGLDHGAWKSCSVTAAISMRRGCSFSPNTRRSRHFPARAIRRPPILKWSR